MTDGLVDVSFFDVVLLSTGFSSGLTSLSGEFSFGHRFRLLELSIATESASGVTVDDCGEEIERVAEREGRKGKVTGLTCGLPEDDVALGVG